MNAGRCLLTVFVFANFQTCLCTDDWLVERTVSPNYASLEQVAYDSDTNSVYIGGKNAILQLDATTLVVQNSPRFIGPVSDHIECAPPPQECSHQRTQTANHARVLEINKNDRTLFYCGSALQGLCTAVPLVDINVQSRGMPSNNVINYVGGGKSVVAFFAPGVTNSGLLQTDGVLYSAISYDGRPDKYTSKTVSGRVIKFMNGLFNMTYAYTNKALNWYTGLSIVPKYRNQVPTKYVYGFPYGSFSYFIVVEKLVREDRYTTRLARVCQNDAIFTSYIEIPLACKKFNIAQAGHLYRDGEMLVVAFGKINSDSEEPNPRFGSRVCAYTMQAVQDAFERAVRTCYQGGGPPLMSWFHDSIATCTRKSKPFNTQEEFCRTSENPAIQGEMAPAIQSFLILTQLATSVVVKSYTKNNQRIPVAVIGTDDGHLLKTNLTTTAQPFLDLKINSDSKIARDMEMDKSEDHLYLMSGSKLTKFALNSCRHYNECSSCLSARDPLDCLWCGDGASGYCSTEGQCLETTKTRDSCPPALHYFTPTSGPNAGGTRVTIYGRAFGRPTARRREVMVADVPCEIEEHTNEKLVCTTGSRGATGTFQRDVTVQIVDSQKNDNGFEIRGDATSKEDFFYHDASVTSVGPSAGPKSGGTKVVVKGTHLDIGSKATVTVAGFKCGSIQRTSSELACLTEAFYTRASGVTKRAVISGAIAVSIDSATLDVQGAEFTYKDDPVIADVLPKKSILSGGLSVTILGQNLDIVQFPQMGITAVQDENVTTVVDCTSYDEGAYMVCPSPNLTSTSIQVTPERPLLADIWFVMDGVDSLRRFHEKQPSLARFSYYPDPEVDMFQGGLKLMYTDNKQLTITGRHLNLGNRLEDVQVLIAGDPCDVTNLGEFSLQCTPTVRPEEPREDEPIRNVTVKIGSWTVLVGHVKYTKINYASVIIPLSVLGGILVLVGLVLLVVFMRRRQMACFKEKADLTVAYDGQRISGIEAERERFLSQGGTVQGSDRYARAVRANGAEAAAAEDEPDSIDEETWLLLQDSHLLIDGADLAIDHDHIIGQGHFGCVFKGTVTSVDPPREVAVKTLHASLSPKEQDLNKFLQEALIMKDFHHVNVLELVGISMENKTDMPLVILPFMRHGDLLSYIRDENQNPTVRDLMQFSVDIARGMAYLSELKFVHRDLAARNCMLGKGMVVKVADFGLSRDVYERDYYASDDKKAKLPVKWMALESLEKGVYSSRTDVWSYGIVLWELMTRGVCPYPDVDNWDIIRYLKSGRRMPQPAYCPNELYDIMRECWAANSHDRPLFTELVDLVDNVIQALEAKAKGKKAGDDSVYCNVPTHTDYIYQDQESITV